MRCIRQIGDASDSISLPPMGRTVQFSARVSSQIVQKMPDFGTLWAWQMGYYYEEGQPLLMKCFKTFFRCIMQMGDASGSISLPLTAHTVPSQPTLTLKLYTKCQSFWYPLSMANGMICYKERHPLFMECFQTILRCTRQMRGASHSICLQLMGLIVPFSTETNSQITPKIPDFGTRSVWQMGGKGDVVSHGDTTITYEVFQNNP